MSEVSRSEALRPSHPIRAVDRVCDILDLLAVSPNGVSLSEVAQTSSLPKSSAFRYLAALAARGYARRGDTDGLYRLGLAFRSRDDAITERIIAAARPVLEKLRDDLEETVNLGILEGSEIVHLAVLESPHTMRLAARVHERADVHSTALGKVLCAELPTENVRSILEREGMSAHTAKTITSAGEYFDELARVAQLGFAVDDEEHQLHGRCVAVRLPHTAVLVGLSVSAPAVRLTPEDVPRVAAALQQAAVQVSSALTSAH